MAIANLQRMEAEQLGRLWESDYSWDTLQYVFNIGFVVLPLRDTLQVLAKKHRDDPLKFAAEFKRVLLARARVLGLPVSDKPRKRSPQTPSTISRRQVKGLRKVSEIWNEILQSNGKLPKRSFEEFVKIFRSLLAGRPGPKPSPETQKIERLYIVRGIRSPVAIARHVFGEQRYNEADSDQKKEMRDQVRDVIESIRARFQ